MTVSAGHRGDIGRHLAKRILHCRSVRAIVGSLLLDYISSRPNLLCICRVQATHVLRHILPIRLTFPVARIGIRATCRTKSQVANIASVPSRAVASPSHINQIVKNDRKLWSIAIELHVTLPYVTDLRTWHRRRVSQSGQAADAGSWWPS